MEKYKGSGNSGVSAFENTKDGIILKFKEGGTYLYNYTKPGRDHVKNMKMLAMEGTGLTTYVNQHVRDNYYKKLT